MIFSYLPDLSQIPFYLVLGYKNESWAGATISHPFLSFLYFFQHSFFFSFIILLPIIIFFRLPKITFFAYLLHLAIDIFTHTGEWTTKIFYPFNFSVSGFASAWEWTVYSMASLWLGLLAIIFLLQKYLEKNGFSANKN